MRRFRYIGEENADPRFHDGALRPVIGAHCFQVTRANRSNPDDPFTYNHAPMLARWHGLFWLMYLSSPVDEHGGLARAMLTSSRYGVHWAKPGVLFPEIDVPGGIYRGKGAELLKEGAKTVVHHRMGFYTAPNGVLLACTFHGVSPDVSIPPNSGWGMGRVVRRILNDKQMGPIHVLRVNEKAGFRAEHFPYPMYTASPDAAFRDACEALLHDRAANAAWWEEERLDEAFFPLKNIAAPSICPMPDGMLGAIGKMGMTSFSADGGAAWEPPVRMQGLSTATGKCALTRGGDGKYLIICNPSPDGQHRWPLAVVTSDDGYTYGGMACVSGEISPARYGGKLKNSGLNYVRCIMPGNDDAPDGYTWLTFSMNKEDIWAVRLPPTIETAECEPVCDRFDHMTGTVPEKWHVHSPILARAEIADGAFCLHTGDPADCAVATRVFRRSTQAQIRLVIQAAQPENGEMRLTVCDARGMPALHLTLCRDGAVRVRGGSGLWPAGTFADGETIDIAVTVDCESQSFRVCLNGGENRTWPLMCPCRSIERLTIRTGPENRFPDIEDNLKNVVLPDLPDTETPVPNAVYRLLSLTID